MEAAFAATFWSAPVLWRFGYIRGYYHLARRYCSL
jgi:hypothetical protein